MSLTSYGWIITLLFFTLSGCDFSTDDLLWTPTVTTPVVTIGGNVEDLSDLEDKIISFELNSIDLGYPAFTTVDVPPLYFERLGPQTIDISDYFLDVDIDSSLFTTSITNIFPIPIDAGTKIVIRSANDTLETSIVYQFEITQSIPAGQTYAAPDLIRNRNVPSKLFVFVEDFQSAGGDDVIFSNTDAQFEIFVDFLSIVRVRIKTNKSHLVSDTSDIELSSNDIDSNFQDGILYVHLKNELPTNGSMQLYFLNDFQNIVDSLFDGFAEFNAGLTNVIDGSSISSDSIQLTIPIDLDRIDLWENSSAAIVLFELNTNGLPGTFVTASKDLNVEVLVSGDLNFNINLE